ncbi:helix-turn-helix domain-containing protein [Tsukamurella serpentis]
MTTSLNTGVIPPEPVGARLARARNYAGHEQGVFAELLGTSRRTVSRMESGAKAPTRPEMVAWAFATGVDLHWLETGEAPSPGGGDGASECAIRDSNPEPAD